MNRVIEDFGAEWERFSYLDEDLSAFVEEQFGRYMRPIQSNLLSAETTIAADFGAGSGRWTRELSKYVKEVHSIEPSEKAFQTLRSALRNNKKVIAHHSTIEDFELGPNFFDFAMSLGVLHHIENTQEALNKIFSLLKHKGVFLGYLYYSFENKPSAYRLIWKLSNILRFSISRLPSRIKLILAELIAHFVYWPLARFSLIMSRLGFNTENFLLHQYSRESLYVMRNDALDRFGTRLEKRFSKAEITEMLLEAGADPTSIRFSDEEPFWCFSAAKN